MDTDRMIIPDQRRGAMFDTHILRKHSLKVVIQEIPTRLGQKWLLDFGNEGGDNVHFPFGCP